MSLGVTASHLRKIKPGTQYDRFFPATIGTNPLLTNGADVFQTVDFIEKLVKQTLDQTSKIAPVLKGASLMDTCKKIFDFCYGHIQYKLDKPGEEQLRTPARAWKDRKTGIDCDCFSIFVSSILHNLGIRHAYRICEINNKGYFQHIYVVVPKDQSSDKITAGQYIVIDPVLDKFNIEAPGISKTSDKMSIPVRVLNGIDNQFLGEIDSQNTLLGVHTAFKNKVKSHIRAVKANVVKNPKCLGSIEDQSAYIGMLDFAEQAVESGSDQDLAKLMGLGVALEQQEAMNGLAGVEGFEGLGKAKFLKKVATAVKSVKTEVKKAAATVNTSKAVAKVKTAAKTAVQAVAKYNPVNTSLRAGFLVAMSANMFGIADQLKWGYATPEQIKRYGISSADHARAKASLDKVTKMFVNDLKGQPENLKKAILSGKQKLDGLGVVAAASTSAAMAFILKAKDFIKGLKIVPKITNAIKNNKDLVKAAKDKATGLLTKKKPTTIENNTLVEKDTTEQATPPPSDGGGVPPQTDGSTPSEMTYPDPVVSDQGVVAEDTTAAPEAPTGLPAPEEKKGLSTGAKVGIGLGILAVVGIAASGKSKSKGLSGPKAPGKKKSKVKKARKAQKVTQITVK